MDEGQRGMRVVLAGEIDATWRAALAAALPEATWLDDAAEAEAAIVANPPPGALAHAPRLRLIQSLWAGVDRLLDDATLPPGVPVARMVDPVMNRTMAETVLWAVLSLHRDFFAYARQQRQGLWQQYPLRHAGDVPVLVLGQGEMGRAAATVLQAQGYRVSGWRRGVPLLPLLATHTVVVNLLPLTPATRGLLDAAFFAALPRGASLVNLGRGPHVVDADLLAALDSGQLAHAVLDVFHQEPLPPGHRFWTHERVTLLPHVAAATSVHSASAIAAANLRALRDGRPIAHLVDRARGY